MITFKRALEIHAILIDRFGGKTGVRDHSVLEAALTLPYLITDQKEVHPSAVDKAAVLLENVLINAPFIDGNKRTGYVLARLILLNRQQDLAASVDEKYAFLMETSRGNLSAHQIRKWLSNHIVSLPPEL